MATTGSIEATDLGLRALERIAKARDKAISQSNRFLLVGMVSSLFYGVKVASLRIDLVISDTRIFETPYGLFVFGVIGSVSFILAQFRFLDGKALDSSLAELANANGAPELSHQTFPSENNWLQPASERFGGVHYGAAAQAAFSFLGICALLIYAVPLIAGLHFLWNWPELAGENYTAYQWWVVMILLLLSLLVYLFCQFLYYRDTG